MAINFDAIINRHNTNCLKYDLLAERGLTDDTIPLWVADMDFQAPPAVSRRLREIAEHNIYGYSFASEQYRNSVLSWFKRRFDWDADAKTMLQTPGVVFAVSMAIQAYTKEGDGVLIQEPVYHPFRATIQDNRRELVVNPLRLTDGRYEIDFEDMERKIIDQGVKLFILCSPHNPVGRVWTEAELRRMGEICLKYDLIVVSDEIHADFVFEGHVHTIFSRLGERFADRSIICTAGSKTFNLAGLNCSNIFIQNEDLRNAFIKKQSEVHVSGSNLMGLAATEAAYSEGEEWLDQLKVYLSQNIATVRGFLNARMPEVKLIEPEGTYLLWLDFRELGLSQDDLNTLLMKDAKVWLNDGAIFGAGGEGFQRMNVACPRALVKEALERMAKAIH